MPVKGIDRADSCGYTGWWIRRKTVPVTIDRNVMHGEPVVAGTRVSVAVVVGSLAGGMSYQDVMTEYDLSRTDILDCLKYAAEVLTDEQVFAVVSTSGT